MGALCETRQRSRRVRQIGPAARDSPSAWRHRFPSCTHFRLGVRTCCASATNGCKCASAASLCLCESASCRNYMLGVRAKRSAALGISPDELHSKEGRSCIAIFLRADCVHYFWLALAQYPLRRLKPPTCTAAALRTPRLTFLLVGQGSTPVQTAAASLEPDRLPIPSGRLDLWRRRHLSEFTIRRPNRLQPPNEQMGVGR